MGGITYELDQAVKDVGIFPRSFFFFGLMDLGEEDLRFLRGCGFGGFGG